MATDKGAKVVEIGHASVNEDQVVASMEELESLREVQYDTFRIEGFLQGRLVRIGSLNAGDIIEWSEANEDAKRTAGLRLITKSLVGPEPENVRYADDPKNIPKFRLMNHRATEQVVKRILKLNGMNVKDDNESKKD